MSVWEPTEAQIETAAQAHRELIAAWGRGEANCDHEDVARAVLLAVGPDIAAQSIYDYVEAARKNPSVDAWEPFEVLDDAEEWATEIEREARRD